MNFFKTLNEIGLKFNLFGSGLFSGFINDDTNVSPDYKFTRMGYTSSSILVQSGDLLLLWAALFILYIIFYALEFVLHSVPYIRTLC